MKLTVNNNQLEFSKVLSQPIKLLTVIHTLPTKGRLVYEYNPFRNYRLQSNKYYFRDEYLTLRELYDKYHVYPQLDKNNTIYYYLNNTNTTFKISLTPIKINGLPVGSNVNNIISTIEAIESLDKQTKDKYLDDIFYFCEHDGKDIFIKWYKSETDVNPILYKKGQLIDFITDLLSFNLENPVMLTPQYSYDGSVNLIMNDGINIPRIINSRFSVTGKNTYEIIDRNHTDDTNIYDEGEQFDIDTSLYKTINKIPKILFNGCESGGNLPIGNYHFYFKLADADDNETDFVGESGLVSIFLGFGSYQGSSTGQRYENSRKSVKFTLSNIDSAYDYIKVYYSRYTAENNENILTQYCKIEKKFSKSNSDVTNILITGFEDITEIPSSEINLQYNIIDSAKAQAECQNMLFLGNVHKQEIPYNELLDLSLRIYPQLIEEDYGGSPDYKYNNYSRFKDYTDPEFIYNKTGYWTDELYRFGIVYILPNNELTPVFNIRGAKNVGYNPDFTNFPIRNSNGERLYVTYNENTNYIIKETSLLIGASAELENPTSGGLIETPIETNSAIKQEILYENIKGVVSFHSNNDTDKIFGINFQISDELATELKKYVKGFFFVRQTRIPLILVQGMTIGIDLQARTPSIPTQNGVIDRISSSFTNTHVIYNLQGINYVSEGFLNRYKFKFERKKSSIWSKIGKIAGVVAIVVAAAAATVLSLGTATAPALVGACASVGALIGGDAVIGALIIIAGATAATASTAATIAGIQELTYITQYNLSKNEVVFNGRQTPTPKGAEKVEETESRKLDGEFDDRCILSPPSKNKIQGIICPDFEINQEYYNQIFTGDKHVIKLTNMQGINPGYFTNENRHFYHPSYFDQNVNISITSKVTAVPANAKCIGLSKLKFRSRAGEPEEAWHYESIGTEFTDDDDIKTNSDIIRGSYGPYLAFDNSSELIIGGKLVNIYIPGYDEANMEKYIRIRMDDNSVFNAISERISINDLSEYQSSTGLTGDLRNNKTANIRVFRGDCYLCLFTHRVNWNFNDPSAPYNDKFVDVKTWKENYNPAKTEKYADINLGDINAVQLGMWVTMKLRSSNNLNIRTLDKSNVDETAMCGHPRGYYPYYDMLTDGAYKNPDSQVYNRGFSKSLSERWNFTQPDVPHIKNWFGTRIMYSDIHINDAYKNGYRTFKGTCYRDYTREYGEITKLISLNSNLVVIFEHGIGIAAVNKNQVLAQNQTGNNYITTQNVLPENLTIISDVYGSLWPDSIIKSPGKFGDSVLYIYGVDTVAKKIWRTNGQALQCISDLHCQEFLNNNITLSERELTPKLGIRNVKTVYNAHKRDVLFTYYDNIYGFEEKAWCLCWNELLEKWITFYSWIPSVMENIDNIPFSFDRNTSKYLAKLGVSHTNNSFADGVTLSNVVFDHTNINKLVDDFSFKYTYITKLGEEKTVTLQVGENYRDRFIGVLSLSNRILPDSNSNFNIKYSLEYDRYRNKDKFIIKPFAITGEQFNKNQIQTYYAKDEFTYFDDGDDKKGLVLPQDAKFAELHIILYALYLKENQDTKQFLTELYYRNSSGKYGADYDVNKAIYTDELQIGTDLPIFKNIYGKRMMLPNEEKVNKDNLVINLNIKANIYLVDNTKNNIIYYNNQNLVDVGYYESTISICPKWNLLFLTSDFWKHGQAGLIDITDDIYPTYWYGKQHPFEFEVVVVNDPSVHKIFTNLELIANKAKPESFHYEVIGETYDFAKDKVNMFFRQEAIKSLWQYNGGDITYDRNYLKVLPKQQRKSADLPHVYYSRQDTINEIEDSYISATSQSKDYRHLSGAEIVYYPNRQEYRIWNHAPAVDIDDLSTDRTDALYKANSVYGGRGLIAGNMRYLEDRWKVTINPIIICYKNEYNNGFNNTSWQYHDKIGYMPKLPIRNSAIPETTIQTITQNEGTVSFPPELTNLGYTYDDIDNHCWLNRNINVQPYDFGEAMNRKEVDVRDKFVKIRIRYSGEELAVIDFLNTVYRISYS